MPTLQSAIPSAESTELDELQRAYSEFEVVYREALEIMSLGKTRRQVVQSTSEVTVFSDAQPAQLVYYGEKEEIEID